MLIDRLVFQNFGKSNFDIFSGMPIKLLIA
ncbi:hypothetical protein Gotur_027285 [Gossypium turneri]